MKTITCRNAAGETLVFPAGFSGEPFLLTDATGVLEARADLFASESALSDGAVYQGMRMQKRNIVLTVRDRPGADHAENREALYSLFRFKQTGVLTFENENGAARCIDYVVESLTADPKKRSHSYQISLFCPSPFWYSAELSTAEIGGVQSMFLFPHRFRAEGEVFSSQDTSLSLTIENQCASDDIGLFITIMAQGGSVINPRIYHIESGERMILGSAENPLTIGSGGQVEITTGRGQKRVLSDNGESLSTYLSEDSEFLTIRTGANHFSLAADRGQYNIHAVFSWRMVYEGA